MTPAPKRRWFQFSIRMLLEFTTIVSLLLAVIVALRGLAAAAGVSPEPFGKLLATSSLGLLPAIALWGWVSWSKQK